MNVLTRLLPLVAICLIVGVPLTTAYFFVHTPSDVLTEQAARKRAEQEIERLREITWQYRDAPEYLAQLLLDEHAAYRKKDLK